MFLIARAWSALAQAASLTPCAGLSSKDVDGTLHFPVGEAAGTVARSACKLSALLGCASLASAVFRNDTVKDFNRTSESSIHQRRSALGPVLPLTLASTIPAFCPVQALTWAIRT